jgi:hypothetical protein
LEKPELPQMKRGESYNDLKKGKNGDWKAEGYTLKMHPPRERRSNNVVVGGVRQKDFLEGVDYKITAHDKLGNQVGSYEFMHANTNGKPDHIVDVINSHTRSDHQRKGLATAAYKMIEEHVGRPLNNDRSSGRSNDANALWEQPNRPFGDGSRLKKALPKFNPNSIPEEQRKPVDKWVEHVDHDAEEKIPRLEGPARARALHRLHGHTKVRRHKSGEREFLLHRGMSKEELGNSRPSSKTISFSNKTNHTSWTPDPDVARGFAEDGGEHPKYIVSAWIKESDIHHVPKAIGSKEPGSARNSRSATFGEMNRAEEHEVIVRAGHQSEFHAAEAYVHVWPPPKASLKDQSIDARINRRGKK